MKVSFEATFEDFMDVCIRTIKNSKGHNSAKRNGWIISSIFVGLVVLAIVPSTLGEKLIWGVIGSFLIALIYPYLYQKSLENRARNYCQNQMGTDDAFLVDGTYNQTILPADPRLLQYIRSCWWNLKSAWYSPDMLELQLHQLR